jgi:hypothetical protein
MRFKPQMHRFLINICQISEWTDKDLVAQSMIFFLAGFDTVSTAMCFVGHLLAVNPDVQEKLVREIDDLNEELDGKLPTYENIQSMEYLDMVISECLRMWTPVILIDRQCNKPFVLEDTNGNKVQINDGDGIMIPTYSIHHDAKYFPDPEKFQGRKTKFAFPLYTVETETKFRLRFHCTQGKRKFRFSSLRNSTQKDSPRKIDTIFCHSLIHLLESVSYVSCHF